MTASIGGCFYYVTLAVKSPRYKDPCKLSVYCPYTVWGKGRPEKCLQKPNASIDRPADDARRVVLYYLNTYISYYYIMSLNTRMVEYTRSPSLLFLSNCPEIYQKDPPGVCYLAEYF